MYLDISGCVQPTKTVVAPEALKSPMRTPARILMTGGPTNIYPEVQQALTLPIIGYLDNSTIDVRYGWGYSKFYEYAMCHGLIIIPEQNIPDSWRHQSRYSIHFSNSKRMDIGHDWDRKCWNWNHFAKFARARWNSTHSAQRILGNSCSGYSHENW